MQQGFKMDLINAFITGGFKDLYFKFKNKKRAAAFGEFAGKHGLEFSAKVDGYSGEIMQMETPSSAELRDQGKKRLSRKAMNANRMFGDSQFQTKLWAFASNRLRGDWQTNCNIMEGTWKGHLMTTFDTLWYSEDEDGVDEGEYSSVFAHCKSELPQAIITPTGLLAAIKSLDEGQLVNMGYHRQKFESTDFNKSWRVTAVEQRMVSDVISQRVIEYLLDHRGEKWHIELSRGGILISTMYTLNTAKIELAMDFLAGLLEHIDKDLLRSLDQQ